MKIFETQESIAIFSDRSDGDLNFYAANKEGIEKNWNNLAKNLGLSTKLPLFVNQVHQSDIVEVSNNFSFPTPQTKADGLITDLSKIPIGVFTADCCPVLISSKKAVSATHAGWKSTLQEICSKTILKHQELFGTKPSELTAFIGPCISQCCFELGDEVYHMFVSKNQDWQKFFIRKDKWHLDLRALNRYQLEKAGIPQRQIIDLDECTYCMQDKYFSYRRMKKHNGSLFSFIYLK
ncbi:MAG: peptidoglycan editing factor PgeF [Candidatus Riflebacteria bacterium]|nr:peptidoglycan editing factor PgeF [Candidatus Riflebacteria bacterium]